MLFDPGKPITTSVPSFAIRFHASGEELEELYPSEEEEKSEKSVTEEKCPESSTAAAGGIVCLRYITNRS